MIGKRHFSEFTKFIFYSIIGAIIFLLVYSIWFDPEQNSVANFYEDAKETITENAFKIQSKNSSTLSAVPTRARLVPSEMGEYGIWMSSYQSCAQVEVVGESQGIYDMKEKACREACGKRNMEYDSTDCEVDLLVCYCEL